MDDLIDQTKAAGQTELWEQVCSNFMILMVSPYELTLEYASDNGLGVDKAGFDTEMEKQRERARNARSGAKSMGVQNGLLTDITTPSRICRL